MSTPAGAWYRWEGETIVLDLRVQPRATRDRIDGTIRAGRLLVQVTAPPTDGAANARLAALLAGEFGVAKSRVRLLSGGRGREKRVAIERPRRVPPWLGD